MTSSVAGEKAGPGKGIYSATKHAVQGMIEALRGELRGTGVKAARILPAAIATEWLVRDMLSLCNVCETNSPLSEGGRSAGVCCMLSEGLWF